MTMADHALAAYLKVKRTERRLAIAEFNLNYWVAHLTDEDLADYFTKSEKIEAEFDAKIERAEQKGY